MGTLLVGMLVVVASAAGFGFALFGRRPVPQPATETGPAHLGSTGARATIASLRSRPRRSAEVTVSSWTRVRSALLLALTVLGLATLIGGVLSIVLVGLVLLAT
jgi:hypothetical protein